VTAEKWLLRAAEKRLLRAFENPKARPNPQQSNLVGSTIVA
jgi:hypothetical protein